MDSRENIEQYYSRLNEDKEDYFQLLGVDQNVILSELEEVYKDLKRDFSTQQLSPNQDKHYLSKLNFINSRIDHMYSILSSYEKRGKYENMGNREINPEDLKELDNVEEAKKSCISGESFVEKRDFPRAIQAFTRAISLDPKRAKYYYKLGKCQMKISSLRRDAQINFDKSIKLENWNAEYWATLGQLFYIEKLYKKAEPYLRESVKLDPKHPVARKLLNEIAPEPKKTIFNALHRSLGKVMPSFFKQKKK